VRSLLASIAFCTRIPISAAFTAEEVGRAARWFPLVGALLGLVSIVLSRLLVPVMPPMIVAVLILLAEVFLTGALHYDGLADTADGLGGGKSPEDCLRIMRDHAIGSYGAVGLILLVALKLTTISTLISRNVYSPFLVLAPTIGRWSVVLLSRYVPYARPSEAVSRHVRTAEVAWATVFCGAVTVGLASWRGAISWAGVAVAASLFGYLCRRKIGGVTGDTLGTTEQLSESIVLLLGVAMR